MLQPIWSRLHSSSLVLASPNPSLPDPSAPRNFGGWCLRHRRRGRLAALLSRFRRSLFLPPPPRSARRFELSVLFGRPWTARSARTYSLTSSPSSTTRSNALKVSFPYFSPLKFLDFGLFAVLPGSFVWICNLCAWSRVFCTIRP